MIRERTAHVLDATAARPQVQLGHGGSIELTSRMARTLFDWRSRTGTDDVLVDVTVCHVDTPIEPVHFRGRRVGRIAEMATANEGALGRASKKQRAALRPDLRCWRSREATRTSNSASDRDTPADLLIVGGNDTTGIPAHSSWLAEGIPTDIERLRWGCLERRHALSEVVGGEPQPAQSSYPIHTRPVESTWPKLGSLTADGTGQRALSMGSGVNSVHRRACWRRACRLRVGRLVHGDRQAKSQPGVSSNVLEYRRIRSAQDVWTDSNRERVYVARADERAPVHSRP